MHIRADMHIHSAFSVDSEASLDAMCQAAIAKGLEQVCFAEHMDLNPNDVGYGYFRYGRYTEAIEVARARYADRIEVLKGVEFGEPHLYPREVERMNREDLDVIIAGIHWLGDRFVGDEMLHRQHTDEELFARYYTSMLQSIRSGGFDVVAHLDLPKRYLGRSHVPAWIDDVLGEILDRGMALEINTSPLRKGVNACSPDLSLLERYVHLGGGRVTVGSDAHAGEEIGAGFGRAAALLAEAGAGPMGIYRQREFVPLRELT